MTSCSPSSVKFLLLAFCAECRTMKLRLFLSVLFFGNLYQGDAVEDCPRSWLKGIENSCFKFSEDKKDWNSAKSACQALRSSLAVVNTDSKQTFLTSEVTYPSWMGLYKDSNWLWVDGSDLGNYTNWKNGEPKDAAGVYGDCGQMYPKGSDWPGKWFREQCTLVAHYICEITRRLQVLPVKTHASVCLGDSVSLQIEIVASYGNLTIQWTHGGEPLDDSEHFALNEDKTVLTIYTVLPPHGGVYQAIVSDLRNTEYVLFNVEVHDLYLHPKVESPITIKSGDSGLLKVEKSEGGILWWIHHGAILRGQDEHYKFPDTEQGSTGTTLQIINAGLEHAGIYEILLKEAGCEIRNVIDVYIFAGDQKANETDEEDEKLWGFIEYRYLKVFAGDFTGQWYIAPAIMGPLILLLVVFIVCMKRYSRSRKNIALKLAEKKDMPPPVSHLLYDNPLFPPNPQIYHPTAEPIYADMSPVSSSHPHSSAFGTYSSMNVYGRGMGNYGRVIGPPVPPPSPRIGRSFHALSDEDFESDESDD